MSAPMVTVSVLAGTVAMLRRLVIAAPRHTAGRAPAAKCEPSSVEPKKPAAILARPAVSAERSPVASCPVLISLGMRVVSYPR